MGERPHVGAVVVDYHTPELTIRAARSILDSEYPPDRLHLVVVDNGGDDADTLRAALPAARVLTPLRNLGYGGGVNYAVTHLPEHCRWVLLLNSDAELASPGTLPRLVDAAEHARAEGVPVGACAPHILFDRREVTVTIEVPAALDREELDGRALGVAVFGVDLDGTPLPPAAIRFGAGFHGEEVVEGRRFRWSSGAAQLHVSVPADRDAGVLGLRVLPSGPAPVRCTLRVGGRTIVHTIPGLVTRFASHRRPVRVEVPFTAADLHDVVNTTGTFLVTGFHGFDRGFGKPDLGQFVRDTAVFGFCGAAALLHRDAWTRLGGFDERFFLYYEDTDLSWRMQRAGWEILYVPDAVVRHRLSVSTGGQTSALFRFHVTRNRLLMLLKNARPANVVLALGGALVTLVRQTPTLGTPEGRATVRLLLRVLASVLRHAPAMLRARRLGSGAP